MSETTETTPAPEPEPTPTPAPDQPAPDTDEPAPTKEAEEERQSRGDRRFAELTARLSAAERREQQREAELQYYRHQLQQQAPEQDTPEQAQQRLRMQIRAEVEFEIKQSNFHAQGNAQYPDWGQRTQKLIDMGADASIARLIVDMPVTEGVRVAGALAEDPEALQRIANLRGEQARAVALGKFAATIDQDAPTPVRVATATSQITRAPAPIRPVTGRANPTFNEYTASGEQLADYYLKRDLERARGRSRR